MAHMKKKHMAVKSTQTDSDSISCNQGNQVQTTKNKRITLDHSEKHHFRPQPFWIALEHNLKSHFRTHLMSVPKKDANEKFTAYNMYSTAMALTLRPWNSLCPIT